jgi:hypothetical protein
LAALAVSITLPPPTLQVNVSQNSLATFGVVATYARKWEKSCCLDQAIASRQLSSVGSVTTRSKISKGKSCCESDSIALSKGQVLIV